MAATVGTIAQIISSPVGGWYTKLNRHEKLLVRKLKSWFKCISCLSHVFHDMLPRGLLQLI